MISQIIGMRLRPSGEKNLSLLHNITLLAEHIIFPAKAL
jgi:hypothetical protein